MANGVSTVHLMAIILTAVYGLVSLIGGTIGYVKANSTASLVAGGISGVLLLLCAAGITRWPTLSLAGAIVISLALAGRFGGKLMEHRSALGDFLGEGAGITALVMVTGGVLVLVICCWALVVGSGPRP